MEETPKLALFRLGQIVATPGALRALERAGTRLRNFWNAMFAEIGATWTKKTGKKTL